ncbi:hypothetical protein KEM60_00390 [Austwickia sp. TVS 96-490-7B]|nr:hypothetical protein [Austwickia sp. TVS 96-490-7B]
MAPYKKLKNVDALIDLYWGKPAILMPSQGYAGVFAYVNGDGYLVPEQEIRQRHAELLAMQEHDSESMTDLEKDVLRGFSRCIDDIDEVRQEAMAEFARR